MAKKEKEQKPRLTGLEAGSYLIMGWANFVNKQFTKGLLFLAGEVLFIYFMITNGVGMLRDLVLLGTVQQEILIAADGMPYTVKGDNSMLCLIFGVVAIVIIGLFVAFYFINLSSARNLVDLKQRKKKAPNIVEDIKDLLDKRFHATLLTPAIIGIVIFTVLPLIFMILIAFTNYDRSHQPPGNLFDWVGVDNFKAILGGNEKLAGTFFPVLSWTLIWAVIATITNYIFGMLLAILINKKNVRLKKLWRTAFVITVALPAFITLLVMRNMFSDYGFINELLVSMNVITNDARIRFLSDPLLAKITIIVVNLWVGIPYTMLLSTGILMNIPEDLYEAARIDGAGPVTIFFKITMPYMLFVTTPYLITQFIGNINNFNVIYLMTAGGPDSADYYYAGSTDLLVTWLYRLTKDVRDYSYASVIGILVFVLTATFSLITFRRTNAYKKEGEFS